MADERYRGRGPRDEGRRERHIWECPACGARDIEGLACRCGKTLRIPCSRCGGQWFIYFRGETTNRCPRGHRVLLPEELEVCEAVLKAQFEAQLAEARATITARESRVQELEGLVAVREAELKALKEQELPAVKARSIQVQNLLRQLETTGRRLPRRLQKEKLPQADEPAFLRGESIAPEAAPTIALEPTPPTQEPPRQEPAPEAPVTPQAATEEGAAEAAPPSGTPEGTTPTGRFDPITGQRLPGAGPAGGGGNGDNRGGQEGGQPEEGGSLMRDVIAVGLALLLGGMIVGSVLLGWRWPLIALAIVAGAVTLPFLAALVMALFVKPPTDWPSTSKMYLNGIIRNVPTNQVWVLRNAWFSNPSPPGTSEEPYGIPRGYYAKREGWRFWIPNLWHVDLGLVSLVPVIRDPADIVVNTKDNQTVEVDWRMETVVPDADSAKKFIARAEQSREAIETGNASAIINLLCADHTMAELTSFVGTVIVEKISGPAKERFNSEEEATYRGVRKYYGIKAIRIDIQKLMPPEVLRDEAAHKAAAAIRADAARDEATAYAREVGGVVGEGAPSDARAAVGPSLVWGRTLRDIKNVFPEIAAAIFGGRGREERR